jgi:hypothetical protein
MQTCAPTNYDDGNLSRDADGTLRDAAQSAAANR